MIQNQARAREEGFKIQQERARRDSKSSKSEREERSDSKSSKREERSDSKSSKSERGVIQNPARASEE